jgi:serine/threonine-protein kinase HipA
MNRTANVWLHGRLAGLLAETDQGYSFSYIPAYLAMPNAAAISKTLKLRPLAYESTVLFAFFDGLIPEGWLLDIAIDNWKINNRDRFGLLLACCQNTIGAVSIIPQENEKLQK